MAQRADVNDAEMIIDTFLDGLPDEAACRIRMQNPPDLRTAEQLAATYDSYKKPPIKYGYEYDNYSDEDYDAYDSDSPDDTDNYYDY